MVGWEYKNGVIQTFGIDANSQVILLWVQIVMAWYGIDDLINYSVIECFARQQWSTKPFENRVVYREMDCIYGGSI